MRITPPILYAQALETFASALRECLEALHWPPASSGLDASVPLWHLGLREARPYNFVTILISEMYIEEICRNLDPAYAPTQESHSNP